MANSLSYKSDLSSVDYIPVQTLGLELAYKLPLRSSENDDCSFGGIPTRGTALQQVTVCSTVRQTFNIVSP